MRIFGSCVHAIIKWVLIHEKLSLWVCFCLWRCFFLGVKTYLNIFTFPHFIFESFSTLLHRVQWNIRLHRLILTNFTRFLKYYKILECLRLILPTLNILRLQIINLFNLLLGTAWLCWIIEIEASWEDVQLVNYWLRVLFFDICFLLLYVLFEFLGVFACGYLLLFDFVNCFFITRLHLTIIII